jgi:hypothetical protein
MHSPFWTISTAAVCVAVAQAASLEDVCTSAYAVAALPAADFYQGITIDNASVTANPVYAANASGNVMFPDSTFDYCNISFSYSHDGIEGDKVRLVYWLPSPDKFKDRFLSTGGGGYLSMFDTNCCALKLANAKEKSLLAMVYLARCLVASSTVLLLALLMQDLAAYLPNSAVSSFSPMALLTSTT